MITLLMTGLATNAEAATITSAASGNWTATTTWVGGVAPGASDTVIIAPPHAVTLNKRRTCAGITISGILISGRSQLTVNGDVGGSGTWNTGSGTPTISLTGNWTFSGTSTGSNARVIFTGANAQALSGVITSGTGSLVINKSGGSVTLGSNIGMTGTFTLTSGTFDAGTFLLSAASGTLSSGTLRVGAATWGGNYAFTPTPAAGVTIDYYNSTPVINGGISYQNLRFSGSGTTADPSGNLTIQGNLTNTGGGTLNFAARNVTLSGTVAANSIAGFTTTGNVSMTKTAGTATFTGAVSGNGLTVNGTGGTLNLGSGLTHTFTGNWTRTSGTLNGGTSTLRLSGSMTGTGGTFVPGTGTVNFNGTGPQSIVGANSWHNLAITGTVARTVTFPSGVAQTIDAAGMFSLAGASGQLLTLAPSTPGSAWLLTVPASATKAISYVSVSWSNAGGGAAINANGTNINGGNNTNWIFGASTPVFTSPNAATFTIGTPGTFTPTASGDPVPGITLTSGTLPIGVTFVGSSLTGTPNPGTGGSYSLIFTASNGVGAPVDQDFTLLVGQVPAFTSAAAAVFTAGATSTFTPTVSGFPVANVTLTGGTLPGGVTFDGISLGGTPDPGTGGSYSLTFTAANGVGAPVNQDFTLMVNEAPAFTSDPAATFIVGSSDMFTPTVNGFPVPFIIHSGDTLPGGLTFDGVTLAGTPDPGTGGSYNITFTAANSLGTATQGFSLTVNQAPTITSAGSTTFYTVKGQTGSFTVIATGYPAPVISLTGGALPAGVTYVNGVISGRPDSSGDYPLQFSAGNGVAPDTVQNFSLEVLEAPVKAGSSPYPSISAVFDDKAASGQAEAIAGSFAESPTLDRSVVIDLIGGFDKKFTATTGYSTIQGKLTVKQGRLNVKYVRIHQ